MTNDFGVDEATGQWISAYFGAIALVQLFYGPLSDRFGEKFRCWVAWPFMAWAGFGSLYSSIKWLQRVIQGLGGGSIISIIRAMATIPWKAGSGGSFCFNQWNYGRGPDFQFHFRGFVGWDDRLARTMFLIGIAGAAGIQLFLFALKPICSVEKLNPLGLFKITWNCSWIRFQCLHDGKCLQFRNFFLWLDSFHMNLPDVGLPQWNSDFGLPISLATDQEFHDSILG